MEERPCTHCHTLFLPTERETEFCCGGCRFVNQLLLGEGLGDFYKLQEGQAGRPVGERPFEPPKTEWLDTLIATLPDDEEQHRLSLRISGVTCVGCVWLIEKLFMDLPGSVRATIFPATAEAEFIWEKGSYAIRDLARELPRYGYVLEDPANTQPPKPESRKLIPRLGLSAAFAMNTMAFALPRYLGMDDTFAYAGLFDLIALLSSTFALLLGGSYFFVKAFAAIRHRSIHIDLPIALGLASAYLGSLIGWLSGESELIYFDFVATFTVLMLGGRYLHLAAAERAQSQLQGQSAIANDVMLLDGSRKLTEGIRGGDQFLISPGQALPVASRLLSEGGEFSLAWMTGEPEPKTFPKGSTVPAGAVPLGQQELKLESQESYTDSLVSRLTREESRHTSSDKVQFVLKYYLLTIIALGLGSGITYLLLGHRPMEALQTMISIFVVSCPCAIGVAVPLVDRRAASALARIGVFVQNPTLWHSLTQIRHIIFDKTGTLTLENPELIDPPILSQKEQAALNLLTAGSLHPLSRALNQHFASQHTLTNHTQDHPGLGISVIIDGSHWTLGKPGWLGKTSFTPTQTESLSCEFACDGSPIATFHFRESLRPRTLQALDRLARNYQLHILSGDQQSRVHDLAGTLGIPKNQAHGSLSPEQKEQLVVPLDPALYLGDGMNDTLAFNASSVTGTPVADRSLLDRRADFLFTCSGLSFLPTLFKLATWRCQTVTLVLAFTILYNIAAITACLLGHMTPLLAAILMPLSSILSLLIAQRPILQSSVQTPTSDRPLKLLKTSETSAA